MITGHQSPSSKAPRSLQGGVSAFRLPPSLLWLLSSVPCLFLLSFGGGCQSAATGRGLSGAIHERTDVTANSEQVRMRMRGLVEPLSGAIVSSADHIIAGTTNPATRRAALLWKIEAVPALREALFRPNSFVATIDAWALVCQMADYFERGPGRQALGQAAPIAVATCQSLERDLMGIAASFTRSGQVTDVRTFVHQFAADHPIRHSIAGRESALSLATKQELQASFSMSEVASSIGVTLDDMARRLDIYGAQLFDQSRWQAELFTLDLASDYHLDQALPVAESAAQSAAVAADAARGLVPPLEKALAVVEAAPDIAAKERTATLSAVHQEVSRALDFGQEQRIAALQHLTKEREAILLELARLMAQERAVLTRDMEQMSLRAADHASLRAAQLAAAVLVAVFAAVVLLLFLARRLFSGRSQRIENELRLECAPVKPNTSE